jgi:hypothetical protein
MAALELIRFLGGVLLLLIPGICLARVLALGNTRLEIFATGSCLGLAMAIYLADLVSHFDLRALYPLWAIVGIACVTSWLRVKRPPLESDSTAFGFAAIAILLLVGLARFAMALRLILPPGTFDPTFHLVLAKQIQLTHHAIDCWPFAGIPLNYPTGSHVLIVVLSSLSGLPLHTIFKDLIPLLGVLTTAQLLVLVRRLTADNWLAICAAAIYGLWAWYGSNDYFRWGGLPNELGMLLFLAMMSIPGMISGHRREWLSPALCFAALILVHHHVMVVAGLIIAVFVLWQIVQRRLWRSLFVAAAAGVILDALFLLPYALHVVNFHSTGMAASGEDPLSLDLLPTSFGYVLTIFAGLGVALCLTRKTRCPPFIAICALCLVAMFVTGEDVVPLVLRGLHKTAFTFFTPTRFLADLNYFLPVFAAMALMFLKRKLRMAPLVAILILLIAPLADWGKWIALFTQQDLPAPILAACDWIQHNTPPDALVNNLNGWMTYLCWRQPPLMNIPISEPTAEYHPAGRRIDRIIAGEIPPDSPQQKIVAIRDRHTYTGGPILWQDLSGLMVVQEWPKSVSPAAPWNPTTSSSSAEVTPAPKPPGPPGTSAPVPH